MGEDFLVNDSHPVKYPLAWSPFENLRSPLVVIAVSQARITHPRAIPANVPASIHVTRLQRRDAFI
jgi:hypothetical protein